MFEYAAHLDRVIDGDTLLVDVDLGFHLRQRMKLRLHGLNAPEPKGPQAARAQAAKDYVESALSGLEVGIAIRTFKIGKWGRFIARVFYGPASWSSSQLLRRGRCLNNELIARGLADPLDLGAGGGVVLLDRFERILALEGMSEEWAQALVDLGVDSYGEVYTLRPSTLRDRLAGAGSEAPLDTVVRWQVSAVEHALSRMLLVSVTDLSGVGIEGARVCAGPRELETDRDGQALLMAVPADLTHLRVSHGGRTQWQSVDLRGERDHSLRLRFGEGQGEPGPEPPPRPEQDRLELVEGVSAAELEALTRVGVASFMDLQGAAASELRQLLADAGVEVGVDEVARWQKSAMRLARTRRVQVSVCDPDGQALAGASAEAGDCRASGVEGQVSLATVKVSATKVMAHAPGHLSISQPIDLRYPRSRRVRVRLQPSGGAGAHVNYATEHEGRVLMFHGGERQRARTVTLDQLPEGTRLRVGGVHHGRRRLVSLARTRDGDTIYTDRVEVDPESLPEGAEVDALLELRGGQLQASSLTREELVLERREQTLGIPRGVVGAPVIIEGIDPRELSAGVPEIPGDLESLTQAQRDAFAEAVAQHPDGVPFSVLQSILING